MCQLRAEDPGAVLQSGGAGACQRRGGGTWRGGGPVLHQRAGAAGGAGARNDGEPHAAELRPPAAYSPEPEVLAPTFNQITQAMPGGAAVAQ